MPALHDTAVDPRCQQVSPPRSEQFRELSHIFLPSYALLFPDQRRKSLERGVVGAQTAHYRELVLFFLVSYD